MKTVQIKEIIEQIINDGSCMVYTDEGSGAGGPGVAEGDILTEMLQDNTFDDAKKDKLDLRRAKTTFADVGVSFEPGTDWIQIKFNISDDNQYSNIAWIPSIL